MPGVEMKVYYLWHTLQNFQFNIHLSKSLSFCLRSNLTSTLHSPCVPFSVSIWHYISIRSLKCWWNGDDMSFIKRPGQLLATIALILILVTIYVICIYDVFFPQKQSAQSINNDLPQVYKDRQSHIESVCEEHHDRLERDYRRFQPRMTFHSVISKVGLFRSKTNNPFLWCKVPKASSRSWNNLFMSIW